MKTTPKTPAQSGRPHSRHDSLRHQATDRDSSNQPREEDDDADPGDAGDIGQRGHKGQPSQHGAQDDQNIPGEAAERQDGALYGDPGDLELEREDIPGPDTK